MRCNSINKIITLILLLYFVGFAVSPVSAIFPADQLGYDEQNGFLKKNTTQTDLFFFDLALWEILTKTKRSDKPFGLALLEEKKNASDAQDIGAKAFDVSSAGIDPLTLLFGTDRFCPESSSSSDKGTRLTRSGLSPPFFS